MPDTLPQLVDQKPNGCWTACMACISGLPYADFPPPPDEDDPKSEHHNAVVRHLHANGWTTAYLGSRIPKGFAIMGGKSPRGFQHAVVAKDGVMVYDPHPSRAGLVKVEDFELVIPILGLLPKETQ